jgi:hypothetical protein
MNRPALEAPVAMPVPARHRIAPKKRQYLRPSLSEMKEIKTTPTIFPELVVRLS